MASTVGAGSPPVGGLLLTARGHRWFRPIIIAGNDAWRDQMCSLVSERSSADISADSCVEPSLAAATRLASVNAKAPLAAVPRRLGFRRRYASGHPPTRPDPDNLACPRHGTS